MLYSLLPPFRTEFTYMKPTNITLNLFTHIKPFQSIYLTPKRHKIKYLPNDSDRITTSSLVVPSNRKWKIANWNQKERKKNSIWSLGYEFSNIIESLDIIHVQFSFRILHDKVARA